jgi:succinoglycan biosynthesis transport protein ExoP
MPLTPLPPPSSNRPPVPARIDPSANGGTAGVWGGYPQDPEEGNRPTPWHRYRAALRRYRWLVLSGLVLGAAAGYGAARFAAPSYESHGTIWISHDDDTHQVSTGPIQSQQLLNPTAWDELFRSYRITDSVVLKERLYLSIAPSDTAAFVGFAVGPSYKAGAYEVSLSSAGDQYTLTSGHGGAVVDRGTAGDSIGRNLGFRWQPSAATLRLTGGSVRFGVATLNQASEGLVSRLTTMLPDNSNFMRVSLVGSSPVRTANTLNEWLTQFLAGAGELKRRKVADLTGILQTQVEIAHTRLTQSEQALQAFEQNAIAHGDKAAINAGHSNMLSAAPPTADGGTGGASVNQEPSVADYYTVKFSRDNLRDDIARVDSLLALANTSKLNPEDLLAVPSLMVGADNLHAAIQEYDTKSAEVRQLKLKYTEEYKPLQDLEAQVVALQTQTIPQLARESLARLRRQEHTLTEREASASASAAQLPSTEIEEMRRRRDVDQAAVLYNTLQSRYEEAQLAEESAIPDVQVLDRGDVPTRPSRDTKPRIFFMAISIGLGLGLALALLLDHLDHRLRYPEQATDDLGLPIVGTVPGIGPRREHDPEAAAQVVEAFRTLRLNIVHLLNPSGPIIFTITSPGAGDGKSLISSNLGMSFAESGRRTLVIDGDIRRGQLHTTFGVHQAPGLLDYLTGEASLEEVLQETEYERLTVVSCGARRHRGPELLASSVMLQFLNAVRPHFDTIIVDSPPLGAGIDPFALGVVTGNMLVVLRIGKSDRQMAEAKLGVLERYPVRVLGAVLNDVSNEGAFRYYSYLYGYELDESEKHAQLPSRVGAVATPT